MGVKIQNLIVSKIIDIQDLRGKIIAVDAPNIIMGLFNYTLKNPGNSNTKLMLDRTQRPISHLYGLLYRVNFYYSKNIFPIFCFDGKVSTLKKIITKDQLKDFLFTQKWYEKAIRENNKDLAKEIALSGEYIWKNIIRESKQLLGALGVPYIESPASAESQCTHLVKKGFVHYSNSQDYDSILFGCPYIIQNLSKSLQRKVQGKWQYQKIKPAIIDLQKNLSNLGISLFQLVDIGILIGTDYNVGVSGVGPKKALDLIRKYKSLESVILKEYNKYNFSRLNPSIIKEVRKIFIFPDVNEKIDNLLWNPPNESRIFYLMCEEHYLNKERVEKNLDKLKKNYEICRDHFFHQKQQPKKRQITLDNLL